MEKINYESLKVVKEKHNNKIISLRPLEEKDTELIVRWRNSDRVRSQFIFRELFTNEMHNKWFKTKVLEGKVIQYIIEDDIHNKPVGSIYIRDIDIKNESGEFGIFIGDDNYISKGYGTTSIKMFISYCFSIGFHRIFLRVLSKNQIAKQCYLNAGFSIEGVAKHMVNIDGEWIDIVFMSIINE